MREALTTLRERNVAQAPVLAAGRNVGSVTEEELMRSVLQDSTTLERSVGRYLSPPFLEIDAATPLSDILRHLKEDRALLVRGPAGFEGILTRQDLLRFFTRNEEDHAI